MEFTGNTAVSDSKLEKQMKENRAHWCAVLDHRPRHVSGRQVRGRRRARHGVLPRHGYVRAQVGEPELKVLGESKDKKTHWIELRIPVTEGHRTRSSSFDVAGNTVVKSDALKPLFKLQKGEYYSQKMVRKGFQKAQEIYGAGGYMEFTGYPDYKFSDDPNPAEPACARRRSPRSTPNAEGRPAPPTVDVTLQIQEGKQFLVNRIIFTGNTTTRDNVIRRELRLFEDGVFNTEALKYSVKRLNQLGYFKPLEGPGRTSRSTRRRTPRTRST